MSRMPVQELMEDLLDTLLSERSHAKERNMKALMQDMTKKQALVHALEQVDTLKPEEKELAKTIKRENNRNTILFSTMQQLFTDTLALFGRKKETALYGQTGSKRAVQPHGYLLSGKF